MPKRGGGGPDGWIHGAIKAELYCWNVSTTLAPPFRLGSPYASTGLFSCRKVGAISILLIGFATTASSSKTFGDRLTTIMHSCTAAQLRRHDCSSFSHCFVSLNVISLRVPILDLTIILSPAVPQALDAAGRPFLVCLDQLAHSAWLDTWCITSASRRRSAVL